MCFRGFTGALALGIIGASPAQATNFGVVFAGGWDAYNNWDRYYNETARMWNIMTGTLGFSASNVHVLFADGTDPGLDQHLGSGVYVDSDWSMVTSAGGNIAAGTYANLAATMSSLQSVISPDDCFHFWAYDHGALGSGNTIDDVSLCAWNRTLIPDDVFASWANPINAYAESYVFGHCYAGGMVNDLNILPGQNRYAAWSTPLIPSLFTLMTFG